MPEMEKDLQEEYSTMEDEEDMTTWSERMDGDGDGDEQKAIGEIIIQGGFPLSASDFHPRTTCTFSSSSGYERSNSNQ